MWPLNMLRSPQNRKGSRKSRRPQRAGGLHRAPVALRLEPLEDRWLPDAAMPPAVAPSPQPSFAQAAVTLLTDGFYLGQGIVNQYVFLIPEVYSYPVSLDILHASINFNSPYAGPFAPLLVQAGAIVGAEVQYQLQIEGFKFF